MYFVKDLEYTRVQPMPRRYELKRRAERQRQTRQRIVDAAVDLHATVGPARTTITAVAERAGVQRHTVYRHFPTEDELFGACTSAWDARNPFPDPAPWRRVADPVARLRCALLEIYGYYARVEPDLTRFLRDADLVPAVRRALADDARNRERVVRVLAAGWRVRGTRRRLLVAAIGHALEFQTWRSLVLGRGLAAEEAADLMTRLARAAAAGDA